MKVIDGNQADSDNQYKANQATRYPSSALGANGHLEVELHGTMKYKLGLGDTTTPPQVERLQKCRQSLAF